MTVADDQQRQTGGAWARDVLLTFFLPPLGVAFTGAELFRPSLRRRFTRGELIAVVILFVIGVLLTIRIVAVLSLTVTAVDDQPFAP